MSTQKSLFSNPVDIFILKKNRKIKYEENYEFDESDSHITGFVKNFWESDDYLSENESKTTIETYTKSGSIDSCYSTTNKLKLSTIFKENVKSTIKDFKSNLLNNFKSSILLNNKIQSYRNHENNTNMEISSDTIKSK